MKPYMFVINAVPMATNKSCETIAGAKIHIWVIADDKEDAKLRALDDINRYQWEIVNIEYELEIQPEQIPRLHKAEALLYQKALKHGIAADYIAHPKTPGRPDNPAIIRRLDQP